jgi:antagonist of KipI
MKARIIRSGPQTAVQDLGRVCHRAVGVGTSGALDPFAARIANTLVANHETAAVIEIALGNFRMRFTDDRLIAWCGGEFDVRVEDCVIPPGHVCVLSADEELTVKSAKNGCRLWLAIAGGIDVPVVLGSRSTDLRAEFGGFDGRTLRDGDEVQLGELSPPATKRMASLRQSRVSSWSAQKEWSSPAGQNLPLRFIRGTDWNLFADSAHDAFTAAGFIVTHEADRMGVRLDGPELTRHETNDLLSEAVAPGTVQVPPSGRPILLLGDCQTIGGYPKIAHVITVDLPAAAQLRPDDRVRFQEISVAQAHSLLFQRTRDLELFRAGLALKAS